MSKHETWYRVSRHGTAIEIVSVVRFTPTLVYIAQTADDTTGHRDTRETANAKYTPDWDQAKEWALAYARNNRDTATEALEKAMRQIRAFSLNPAPVRDNRPTFTDEQMRNLPI